MHAVEIIRIKTVSRDDGGVTVIEDEQYPSKFVKGIKERHEYYGYVPKVKNVPEVKKKKKTKHTKVTALLV